MISYLIIIKERDVLVEYSLVFIFGAVFGSFLNVIIYRVPQGLSIITPRSSCPNCKTQIKWIHNIPLLSFLILKAKCAYCKEKISPVYFVVELISSILTFLIFIKLGFTIEFFIALIFFYTLIVLAFIDFKYHAVPDYMLLIAFVLVFFVTSFSLKEAFINAFIFAGAFSLLEFLVTFYIQNVKARLLKDKSLEDQKALGEGDIPIIAAIGALLGIGGGFVAIFLAAFFAIIPTLIFRQKNIEIPFIPYLLLGLSVEYIFEISKVLI